MTMMALTASCYYDQEEVLYPETNCTPVTNPLFETDVKPILDTYCNTCHSGNFASGGIRLDTYTETIKHVNNGSLLGSVKSTGGFSPMPKNGSKLSACRIQVIENWITAGSPGN